MKITYKRPEEINVYSNNPRNNAAAVPAVKTSIEKFGFINPIILDNDDEIICGHTRLKAALELELDKIPCIYASELTPDKVKEYRLADNKTAELAKWDIELLETELKELYELDVDIDWLNFDIQFDVELIEDDYDMEQEAPVVSKKNDIWLLGNHRVMCGDSTKESDVTILMNDEKANLVITDPPYNNDYTGKTKKALKIKNDNMVDSDFMQFLLDAHKQIYNSMQSGASIYLFHSDIGGLYFRKAFIESGLKLSECLIWVKNMFVFGRQDYHWRHESILYGWKEGVSHNWYGDRKQDTVLLYNKPSVSEEHPTMKPVGLLARLIENSSKKEDIVLDSFAGSGSTLIAADQLSRKAYCMEYDEKYVDVIVNRYIKYKESTEDIYLVRDGRKINYKDLTNE